MEQLIFQFFEQFSYLGIAAALTFEFIPGELVLPLAGYLVYQGKLELGKAVLAGTLGGVTGPLTLYLLGKYGGRPFLNKYGKYIAIKEKHFDRAEHFFKKHGGIVAFTGRFIPGIRTLISIPCGIARMNVWLFCFYTCLAMAPITYVYIYIGYRLGPHWRQASTVMEKPLAILLLVLLIVLVIFFFPRKKQTEAIKLSRYFKQ